MLSHGEDEQSVVDQEAEKLLDRLKNTRIPAVLKSENIFKYKVHWSSNGITRQNHSEYIEQFNNDFYTAMKQQIDRCIQSRLTTDSDHLQHEVLEHAIQCKTYVTKFHGRNDVLSKV
jgi:CRISPR/Cas system CSM-associated protein Csm3 (group 7 of RAMP superfamily)